jgi:SAM-dependent methyltransferase
MSFFGTSQVAKGYAKNRPYFHPEVIRKIKNFISIDRKIRKALDVGCGAGLSTLALLEIADKVTGVDSSEAMVGSAIEHEDIQYFNYPAENLPFDEEFGLITLAGAINWVDRTKFFAEAKKILPQGGYVVVYDNTILGIMKENDGFKIWYDNVYLKKYPKPPRNESPITGEEAVQYGFEFVRSENYTNEVQFTLESFINYIFTQSNITTALQNGAEDAECIQKWFVSSLSSFYQSQKRTLLFGGYIWYLRNQ